MQDRYILMKRVIAGAMILSFGGWGIHAAFASGTTGSSSQGNYHITVNLDGSAPKNSIGVQPGTDNTNTNQQSAQNLSGNSSAAPAPEVVNSEDHRQLATDQGDHNQLKKNGNSSKKEHPTKQKNDDEHEDE